MINYCKYNYGEGSHEGFSFPYNPTNIYTLNCQVMSYLFTYLANYLFISQWPSGLRRGSAAARLLKLRVRIPPRAWMFACCKCCVFDR